MKTLWNGFKKYCRILNLTFLSFGIVLLVFAWFVPAFSPVPFLPVCLILQFLLCLTGEKGLRMHFALALLALLLLPAVCLLLAGKDPASLLLFYQILLPALLSSLLCYVIRNSLVLKGILLAVAFCTLLSFSLNGMDLPKWGILLLLFSILFYGAEAAEQFGTKRREQNSFYLFPFLLAFMVLMMLLPVSDAPIQWNGVKKVFRLMGEHFNAMLIDLQYLFDDSPGTFSFEEAGFSPDGSLGGTLFSTDNTQLTVEGTKTFSTLYLTGSIFNEYTGKTWNKSSSVGQDAQEEYLMQHQELEAAFSASIYSEKEAMQLVHPCTYTVTYKGIKTKHLFYPPHTKTLTLTGAKKTDPLTYDHILLKKAQGYGFSYRFLSWEINYGDDNMIRLLRQQAWKDETTNSAAADERLRLIREQYLSLPGNLPPRVYELSQTLTDSLETDYDKLKAIEEYLRKLQYTTTPAACPETMDFVDYFLFESPGGYCTYFATAMAVLGRCAGIPTRYVEGYAVPAAAGTHNRELSLSGENAHAWPEAYVEHIGWIPFEPTPGFYESAYMPWPSSRAKKAGGSSPKSAAGSAAAAPSSLQTVPPLRKERIPVMEISLLFLCAVTLLAAVLSIRRMMLHRRYMRKERIDKIMFLMHKVFRLCRLMGYERAQSETLTAFCLRLMGKGDTQVLSFSDVCALFSSIRFGGHGVSPEALAQTEAYTAALEAQYLKSCGLLHRMLYRFFRS